MPSFDLRGIYIRISRKRATQGECNRSGNPKPIRIIGVYSGVGTIGNVSAPLTLNLRRAESQELRQMPHERQEGHIRGLHLPLYAWDALRRENIATIDQLRAVADRVHQIPGIGAKAAQVIRAELARVATAAEGQSPDPQRTSSNER
jgi:DNA-directed RNA polymerase alpha subunit